MASCSLMTSHPEGFVCCKHNSVPFPRGTFQAKAQRKLPQSRNLREHDVML